MKTMFKCRAALPLALSFALAGCGEQPAAPAEKAKAQEAEGVIQLTAQQIEAAGIALVRPTAGVGTLSLPATIESDPQATQVVSAAIGGRIVALNRNLGEAVRRGEVVAVIESRDAAGLRAEVEAAQARANLARSNLAREERLFGLKVSPERDLIAARTAMTEANIALRLAGQQLSAAGVGGGSLNRIGFVAPIGGQVTARSVVLGQTVAPDAELFRVANLGRVAINLSLTPADASRVRVGTPVEVRAHARSATARVRFVSPVLDSATRLVPAVALFENDGGIWRPGEPVTAILQIGASGEAMSVPASAIQTVEGRTSVFVRTKNGFRAMSVTVTSRVGGMATVTGLSGREELAGEGSFTLKAELAKGEAEHGGH
ncbi:cobalt-zinc-cadmium efflux system membrane fusion protein [Sphingopyxis sp. OAS728]|uniref:efflux RND transporter periplasmic adaptor subunit n=1 Tax=Sphingopyxis sp. OAS728 TaxID=2663823 RepID=UPI00178B71CF|nr:efflux RND transporter periplasmic adaptor subunit [Sphingopyxis sp. OAS728]MBE1526684.1 cobalt-zinc-cadmium efflux system membrane fusion protein [Sphingopyxis sp. OAS728]